MKSKGKLAHCSAMEPLGVRPGAQQPWSDTYFWFSTGFQRREEWGPTIISRAALQQDLAEDRAIAAKRPDLDFTADIARLEEALETLRSERFVYEPTDDSRVPNIYVAEDYIDRRIAEEAVAFIMVRLGYEKVRFKWERVKTFVTPT